LGVLRGGKRARRLRQQTCSKRDWIFGPDARDGVAKIVDREVTVGVRRCRDRRMPQDALHAVRIDASTEHERRGCVSQVVEAHRPRDGSRPQLHAAVGQRRTSASLCFSMYGAPRLLQRRQECS